MSRRTHTAFLMMDLLVSLGIIAAASGAFLSVYHAVRQQHTRSQHRGAATFVLQSVLELTRAGQLPDALQGQNWTPLANGTAVYPAQPAAYPPEKGGDRFFWQLTANQPPTPGALFTFQTTVSWQERQQARQVTATTQLLLP